MFPSLRVQKSNRKGSVRALKSYQFILNISSFTKRYTDLLWDFPQERSHILHPPVGEETSQAARQTLLQPFRKEKLILGIGRFNLRPTNKNQKIIMRAFMEAREQHPALDDWKLILVGNRNPDPDSVAYHEECVTLAESAGSAIEIRSELPHDELVD